MHSGKAIAVPGLGGALVSVALLLLLHVSPALALTNNLALTPPMGWNSWNNYGCGIDEALIRATADAMATNGMKAAGYQYINLDDCWQVARDGNGVIVADPVKFPSGIKALADYVHARGLKLGLYSDHGLRTCAGRPGAYGYEYLDANTYAAWGVDYLKHDNCNLPSGDVPRLDYARMSDALMRSGRPITFSICAWSFSSWDPDLGNLWRTTGDISDSYASMVSLLGNNSRPAFLAGPGRWNDPDMLEVGRSGMTTTEYRAHFSLWCLMAAPLIAGNNLSSMSATTSAILTNAEVIAVDQDPAGEQGFQVAGTSAAQVWAKPLGTAFSVKAVGLFNNTTNAADITVAWTNIGLQAGSATVRDLWARADLGAYVNTFTTNVPAHGVVLLKVTGTPPALPGLGTIYLSDLQSAYGYVGWGTMTKDKTIGGNTITLNGTPYAKGLGAHAFSGLEYRLGGIASRFQADIGVDDEVGAHGTVVFQVLADGMKIYDSGTMTGGGAHQTLDLDMTGVNRLTLGVADADDGISYDHADWAGARVTVPGTPPAAPPAPTGLAANPGTPIVLTWNPTRSALSYNVKRATQLGGPYTNIAAVSVPVCTDAGVPLGTACYYVVSASGLFGESSNSVPLLVTACAPPATPAGVTASVTNAQITVTWTSVPGAAGYSLVRATPATPFTEIATAPAAGSYTDTNVVGGVIYYYAVAATNVCNRSSLSPAVAAALAPAAPTGLAAAPGVNEVVLTWNAAASPVFFNVKRSANNGGPYSLVASNLISTSFADAGLANGVTYYYVLSAMIGGSESANSAQVSATPCSGGLPAGWIDRDIGNVGLAGSAGYCSGTFILEGGGADIWGTADAFNFASTNLAGDATIVARVVSVQNTDPWAKAGVMFRNDASAGAMFAHVFASPGNGVNFQWRSITGGQCGAAGVGGISTPVWVKLVRAGTNFSAYYGSDGVAWTQIGTTQGIAIGNPAPAGLSLTAHNNSVLCLATFDNVPFTPRLPPALSLTPSGGQFQLSWPGWATSYTALNASNLTAPVWWQRLTNTPWSSNGLLYLSVPVTNAPQQFYRLAAPVP